MESPNEIKEKFIFSKQFKCDNGIFPFSAEFKLPCNESPEELCQEILASQNISESIKRGTFMLPLQKKIFVCAIIIRCICLQLLDLML